MLSKKRLKQFTPLNLQESLIRLPQKDIQKNLKKIYKKNNSFGKKPKKIKIFTPQIRKNTAAIVGIALGDEGKGRLIDNKVESLLQKPDIKHVVVIRFQGGNNAGHTIEKNGIKLDLHLLPAGVLYKEAIGIMDRGMVIHPEDLQTEILYVEKVVGSLKGKLYLSDEAILCTDLERAEEILNNVKSGQSKGGTGRGISPSYAHHYDRLGLKIYDLLENNWEEKLSHQYEMYQKEFKAFAMDLAKCNVPDFKNSHKDGKAKVRIIGSKMEFLKRINTAREFLIKRKIITNTYLIHQKMIADPKIAVLFEGSQAVGLDAWLGTRPDVTSSNTTVFGLREGTGFWLPEWIEEKIGIFKIPYTSSVGARRMPTHIDLPKDLSELNGKTSKEQKWAAYIREEAHEYGTTTGRPRDINFLDLAFLTYNAKMSGVKMLAGTHLDIARENQTIKVCTHYTDKKGNFIYYQPGLRHLNDVIPNYIELPGWDGKACQKAKSIKDLPKNALNFLDFIKTFTGLSIVAVTTGAKRENIINF